MTENELARALFGRREQDDTVSVVVGRALTDSENGTVYVDVGGAVSGDTIVSDPETGEVSQTDGASQGIEVPTPGGIKEGDVVYVIIDGSKPVNATGEGSTDAAAEAAARAEQYAGEAQESATLASGYASSALAGLSAVESVEETLAWVTSHGFMSPALDPEPDPTRVYFVRDDEGRFVTTLYSYAHTTDTEPDPTKTYYVPLDGHWVAVASPDEGDMASYYERTVTRDVAFSAVATPDADDMADYYVLDVNQSLQNFTTTHLSLTTDGLWVRLGTGGSGILIATGNASSQAYSQAGVYIVGESGETVARYGATTVLGDPNGFHIQADGSEIGFYHGATRVAYVSNNQLYINQSVVVTAMQVGDPTNGGAAWQWVLAASGNLTLKWIGA